ncbi:hypothetical protein GSI_07923 [Ganoderma sinense ZZ0214-1]|uniref:Uncharacterized protein n=1 Tax=Ganoderma sinense ZZ0214-1 TaxID=1077348 RepID=A0A2G8S899_9APHY|nr:hypothetical protein GSI_07923 [Ganoderma sinense ZZ0214-1]
MLFTTLYPGYSSQTSPQCHTKSFLPSPGEESTVVLSYFTSSDQVISPLEKRRQWPFATFPTLLSLSNVMTFRLASSVMDPDCLLRLRTCLENVTKLCLMLIACGAWLGVALSHALLADDPVVFPKLCSFEVDVVETSRAFIAILRGPRAGEAGPGWTKAAASLYSYRRLQVLALGKVSGREC